MIFIVVIIVTIYIIFDKLTTRKCESFLCLNGKTAIVTGGNAGIGYYICLNLASRGCKVIIADVNDSSETRDKIIQITNNPKIISKIFDLASFKSIRNFAAEINKNEERLDILINNAGIIGTPNFFTEDGLNPIMQVNYFGPFLLTHLLLDLLKKSKPSRIIFTSSCASLPAYVSPDSFTSAQNSSDFKTAIKVYGQSKLATIMASDLFAEKLKGTNVTSNSLHPGVMITGIYAAVPFPFLIRQLSLFLMFVFGKTIPEAAHTTLHLALSEEVKNISGKFFVECRPFIKPPQTRNTKLCNKVWEITEKCVKLESNEKI